MFGQNKPAGQGVQTYKHKAKSTFSHLLQRNRNPFTDISLMIASKFTRTQVDFPDVRMKCLTIREWCGLKTSIPCNIDFFLSNLLHNFRTIAPSLVYRLSSVLYITPFYTICFLFYNAFTWNISTCRANCLLSSLVKTVAIYSIIQTLFTPLHIASFSFTEFLFMLFQYGHVTYYFRS